MVLKRKKQAVAGAVTSSTLAGRGGALGPSILSKDLQVVGKLESEGEIQIDGQIKGNVRCKTLTIGRQGVVNGDIVADEITVSGRVNGDIRGRKVELLDTAKVEGDILHQFLVVRSGAFLNGKCQHSENPLGTEKKNAGTTRDLRGQNFVR